MLAPNVFNTKFIVCFYQIDRKNSALSVPKRKLYMDNNVDNVHTNYLCK